METFIAVNFSMWLLCLQRSKKGHFPGGRNKTTEALEVAGQKAVGLTLLTEKVILERSTIWLFIGKVIQVENCWSVIPSWCFNGVWPSYFLNPSASFRCLGEKFLAGKWMTLSRCCWLILPPHHTDDFLKLQLISQEQIVWFLWGLHLLNVK